MATRIAGVVFRAADRRETAQFYESLGLTTHEHAHGGPKHHEVGPLSPNCVVEIYLLSPAFTGDAILIEVDSLEATLQTVKQLGVEPQTTILDSHTMRFFYLKDPDGRDVMIFQTK